MPVQGLDHVAITCDDPEATLEFYTRVLGATTHFEKEWREGKMPVFLLQIGGCRLSVHSAKAPAQPHARVPTPGSGDICFRWSGTIAEAEACLKAEGVEIVEGPVPRPAQDGTLGQSVYFRDPDGNLLELLTTDG
jgi:catechol 2,3-dioxygenase-like lactoylglutathione lyase family enzyme